MDRRVLNEKWESLRRCITRVESKTPSSAEALERDLDLQDIVVLNLERAVQVCVDIAAHIISDLEVAAPRTMAQTFERLRDGGVISAHTAERMVKATGFRNLAIHEYTAIDWGIVYRICTEHLGDFRTFMREVEQAVGPDTGT